VKTVIGEVLELAAKMLSGVAPLSHDRWTLGEEVMRPIAKELALCAMYPDREGARRVLVRVAAVAIAILEATAAEGAKEDA